MTDYLEQLREEIEMASRSRGFIGQAAIYQILYLCHEHGDDIERQLEAEKNSFPSGT